MKRARGRRRALQLVRYSFWAAVVEVICWCGYAGSRAYFCALARMTRQIDWREP